ncbi:hypothetical protein Q7P37_007997 [Cladosporium fusiforme]
MDRRIFDQLDQLQRGAREECPRRPTYNQTRHFLADNDVNNLGGDTDLFDDSETYGDETTVPSNFHGLQQSDLTTSPSQQNPFSYRGSRMHPPQSGRTQREQTRGPSATGRFDLSRFSYNDAAAGGGSSSSLGETLPSSPVVNASRRRSVASGPRTGHQTHPMQSIRREQSRFTRMPDPMDDEEDMEDIEWSRPLHTQASHATVPRERNRNAPTARTGAAPPIIQGIGLFSPRDLSDRFRSIFPFPLFNAVQSKCLPVVYNTNDNFVLSAPTGSGKTAVMELAICRLMNGFANGSFKIIYQAPTKSLCSERQRDWQKKFGPFDLEIAELTGDTDHAQLRNVQHASIIITTPEKWDSITRKWKDHQKLMQMVKLFLIDEVHILKEDRGATLEAIVSRMKSVGNDIRFVALSATVPNSQDIATWLGKDSLNYHIPAPRERFGEEFRPVPLVKHVCGYSSPANDFAFEKTLNGKLPDVIARWSQRKPIMVFCFTRSSTVETAKMLANWWATKGPSDRFWESPRSRVVVEDKDLRETVPSGVAFHHAGLSHDDRITVEKAYLNGDVNVICCTSTLAVGVNLPCHMVIIKNTVAFQGGGVCKEYSDLEVMQMLGRAGRPQFDNSAVAVILTRLQKQPHYDKMVSGQEVLESCLHRNLIDHLNAEIGLGTITNASTAKKWLCGTFLYVRLKENPEHYKIDGDASGKNLDERLEIICNKAVALLEEHDLVQSRPKLHCTEFGDAMSRYYLQFETMKSLLALPRGAKTSEILSCIAQAAEFSDIRFRAGEKPIYKTLNQHSDIKFTIPVNLDAPAHKVSLIIQAVLGTIDFPEDGKQRADFLSAKSLIFQNVQRLIRCVIDCHLYLEDAITARNALALARSLGAQVWDDSPYCMKQLDGIGPVAVRKLVTAGVRSIYGIADAEHHRLETILSRQPPFGKQLQDKAKMFPKLRFQLKLVGTTRTNECVTAQVRADVGFMNEKTPEQFQKKSVNICLLAELTGGHLLHFRRTSAKHVTKEIMFEAKLTKAGQTIHGYVMCDAFAGTLETANLTPALPQNFFPNSKSSEQYGKAISKASTVPSKRNVNGGSISKRNDSETDLDEFGIEGIDDSLFPADDFRSIDNFDDVENSTANKAKKRKQTKTNEGSTHVGQEPKKLDNGKWACSHNCKDKNACKHFCCKYGLDKKPKPKQNKPPAETSGGSKQTQLNLSVNKLPKTPAPTSDAQTEQLDLTDSPSETYQGLRRPKMVPRFERNYEISSPGFGFGGFDLSSQLDFTPSNEAPAIEAHVNEASVNEVPTNDEFSNTADDMMIAGVASDPPQGSDPNAERFREVFDESLFNLVD